MSPELDYLGVKPCGCAVAWCSAKYSTRAQIAKDVAGMIRDGLDVERVTTEESRRRIGWCPLHRPVQQEELALAGGSRTPE